MSHNYYRNLSSENELLIYNGGPKDVPVLTMVNYLKWYGIWMVKPNGSVVKVDEDPNGEYQGTHWNDHVPCPGYCEYLAEKLQAVWDDVSFDAIVGRWCQQVFDLNGSEVEERMSKK